MKRIFALLLAAVTLLSCLPFVGAINNWNMEYFLKKYADPHFNLQNEPNRAMTVEEFIGIIYAYSYYGDGNKSVSCRDKNGNAPSTWCAPYVQAQVDKKVVTPTDVSWTEPVTLAFAAQFMARAKGKYSYDSNNLYTFTGTRGLGADDILYLSVAVDHGLIPYSKNMDVSVTIPRKDARKYEIPAGTVTAKQAAGGSRNTVRENHAYFVDCYWDLDQANQQFAQLKAADRSVTMVTFQCGYLNGQNVTEGRTFLGESVNHAEAVKYNHSYNTDPQMQALSWCRENGKLTFLGISNAHANAFTDTAIRNLLSSDANMDTAVREIASAAAVYGFDGVNMGIELTEKSGDLRGAYGNFLKKLSAALHNQGDLLMVTAGAYFTESQESASFYDYSAIDAAADYVHVILYDDFNDTGYPWRKTAGAMSNLTHIGRCLRYAVTRMDASKILMGTSNFAVDFDLTAVKAEDIDYTTAEQLMASAQAAVKWDAASAGGYFEYTDANGHSHQVWLETADGMKLRANLVSQYNLCGFSTYYLASGGTKLLSAQSSISAYLPEVSSAMARNLIPASLHKNYDKAITRAEFCSMIAAFLTEKTGKTPDSILTEKGLTAASFTDCDLTAVRCAGAMGIVTGYPDGSFRPGNTISRQEAATMLTRLAKFCGMQEPNAESVTFAELPSMQAWAKDGVSFISACVDTTNGKRVMGGTGNGKFSPLTTYTREQSAMTMIRLLHALEG